MVSSPLKREHNDFYYERQLHGWALGTSFGWPEMVWLMGDGFHNVKDDYMKVLGTLFIPGCICIVNTPGHICLLFSCQSSHILSAVLYNDISLSRSRYYALSIL